jgi:Ankyrin repeat
MADASSYPDPLHRYAATGNVAGLESIRRGLSKSEAEMFDWNKLCPQTHTWQGPLHLASEGGHYDAVYFLLKQNNVRVDEVRQCFSLLSKSGVR